jgi:hypothetical protein
MTLKKYFFVLLLILCALPLNVHAQPSNAQKIIGTNTPAFLSKPIISVVNAIEKFRSDMSASMENQKMVSHGQPIPLYFFTFWGFVFGNRLVFYGSSLVIIFLILNYFWSLLF